MWEKVQAEKKKGERNRMTHMNLISEEAVMKLTKEMYLDIANTEYDVQTISDCTSYVASKCREYIDERIRRKNIPSAFEGMTNGEAIISLYPNLKYTIRDGRVITTIGVASSFDLEWWNAPYKGVSE